MSAAKNFPTENFIRATHHKNRTNIVAHILSHGAKTLFPHLFLNDPILTPLKTQGWINHTLKLEEHDGSKSYIIRLSPIRTNALEHTSRSTPSFEKERFILEALHRCDFTPTLPLDSSGIIEIAIPGSSSCRYGYLIEENLPFQDASAIHTTRERVSVMQQLGAIMQTIHSVDTAGFGTEFNEDDGRFSHDTFDGFIAEKMALIDRAPISSLMKRWLASRTETLLALEGHSKLFHQDLLANHGNVLIDERGIVRGIIDWEFAGSGPALHFELASLIYALQRDGHSVERIDIDVQSFIEGYGISHDFYQRHYAHDVETLVLLHSVGALIKYQDLVATGGVQKQPWRELFAKRAVGFIHREYDHA